jgi:hypothetical protein
LVEELTYVKCHYKKDKWSFKYRKNTWTGLDGISWKRTKIGKDKGICYTHFKNGKFVEQYFRYSQNGRKAYHFSRNMCELKVVYPNGVMRSEYIGDRLVWDKELSKMCEPCVEPQTYSENYALTTYDRRGRIVNQMTMKNRQKVGEHIENGINYFYVNGLAVPKELYNAKPEDIDPRVVLRIPNAQVRGMMLKKVGLQRLVKECKGKLIDRDESTGNELYDFPIPKSVYKDNDDVEDIEKVERVLKVICTTTKTEYFLRIPYDEHFATCENARQGTFNEFDVEKPHIKFTKET